MAQTVLCVVIEVDSRSAALLREHVLRLRRDEEASSPKYSRLSKAVPVLHFMSMTVSPDEAYDPIFCLEVCFDGPPGPFWAQLEAVIGPQLRDIFRCAKPLHNGAGDLFAAVTAEGSRVPLAPLLEACSVKPVAFHQGNRGLDRRRIEDEGALFLAARLPADSPALRRKTPEAIHAELRAGLLPQFPWLNDRAPARVTPVEFVDDLGRLVGLIVFVLVALSLPAAGLALLFRTPLAPVLLVLTAVFFGLRVADLNTEEGRFSRRSRLAGLAVLLALAGNILVRVRGADVLGIVRLLGAPMADDHPVWFWTLTLVSGACASVLGILVWLRRLERADPAHDAPRLNAAVQRRIVRAEGDAVQSHMFSIVNVKPGVLRAVLLRVGLPAVGLRLRVMAHDGYVGIIHSMRTLHFTHWCLVSNGARLMFNSNYDGSWDSYLDDFIEKAHAAVTGAWSSCVGFPRTRMLVLDGSTDGIKFKAWARHSMVDSLLWFSAYRQFTVDQIERHARLAQGFRKTSLKRREAETWLLDL